MRPTLMMPAIAAAFLLSACDLTPRQQCEAPHRGELRVVRDEIRAVETALARGYRLVPVRHGFGLHYCLNQFDRPELCRADDERPMYDKKRINRAAETAKLNALVAERRRLRAALAQCAAQFPE